MFRRVGLLVALSVGANLSASGALAKEITLTCKSTLFAFNPSRAVQSQPEEKAPVTFTFDLDNNRVTFLEGDAYNLNSATPSIIKWHDGDNITYTFNRDSVSGEEIAHFGASSLNYVFVPCKIKTHKF